MAKATCNSCSRVFKTKRGVNLHKPYCENKQEELDKSLDLSEMTEEDFNETEETSDSLAKDGEHKCKSDECKKSKEALRQRATTYSKKCALLKQEIRRLKRQTPKVNENENTANEPFKLEQILPNIPLKSDL